MATINSHEASPSTSRRTYAAYLSFRGLDTRTKFTDHLYHALVREGLPTFRDDDELERGVDIMSQLQKAIEGSRVSIIVLSKNYASSRFCLDELVMILKCRSTTGHLVLPVFYEVDPVEVRKQTGSFEEAFMRHESRIEMRKVLEWRMALREVANLAGFMVSSNTFEAELIQGVCSRITEFFTTKNRAHPDRQDRCDFSASSLEERRGKREGLEERRGKRNREEISSPVFSLDVLQQHFGNKREDVAKSLGVSVSTLKRNCRYHGIPRWPNRIRNNAVYSEIEVARGSSKRVFQLEGQTTQSMNREGISSHVLSSDILQPHFGRKREDVAKSLGISGLPNPYGEKNPLPTFNTLSTNGQITMENEVGGQNLELNECLPDSFEDPNFQNTRIGSISEFGKTPNFYDSLPGHCRDAEFCFSAVYSETEAAGGSSECVFQLEGQTTQYTAYSNSNAPVFPQPHIASEEVLNENGGSSEDRRDSLASQAEASFEGHVSELSNLTVLACSDAAAPNQPLAMMPMVPDIIPHLTRGSSETFQLEKEMGGQIREPNEFLPDSFQDPSLWDTGNDSIVEAEASFEGLVYESSNLTVLACSDAAAPNQPWATMPRVPDIIPHLTGGSSETFQLEKEMGGEIREPNEFLPDSFQDPSLWDTGNDSIVEIGKTLTFHDSILGNYRDVDFCFSSVYNETGAAGGSSRCAFQLEGQTTQFPAYPIPNDVSQLQIASIEVLSENMGNSEDGRILLASHEASQEKAFFGGTCL